MKRFLRIIFSRYSLSALIIFLDLALVAYLVFYFSIYSVVFFICAEIINLLVFIRIMNRDINPEIKLAWLSAVAIVPLFGSAVYLILSSKTMHGKEARRMADTVSSLNAICSAEAGNSLLRSLASESGRLAGYACAILQDDPLSELYSGGVSNYYTDGESFFNALKSKLCSARRYIFIETFILAEGEMWDELMAILSLQASRGVEVRLLYDDFGSMSKTKSNLDTELQRIGIRVLRFGKITPRLAAYHNNRDHRKIVSVDGECAFTGGMNIADEYINRKARFGHWKDGGIRVEGEAARGFTKLFLSLWHYTEKSKPAFDEYLPPRKIKRCGVGYAIPFGSGPSPIYPSPVCKNLLMGVINCAESFIYITTPYLIIDYELTEALCSAAKRGVDVRIITPGIPDKRTVNVMTKSAYPHLIGSGVRIFEYTPGFIHEKSVIADREVAVVGTVNLDYRSLVHHYECGIWLAKCPVISQILDGFMQTLERCVEITPDAAELKLPHKIAKSLVRIFAPLL